MTGERQIERPVPLAQRFELRAKLGEGGMGVVYRAWDNVLQKEVALKRVRDVDGARARRLKSEYRARSAIQHPNLVQLYELVIETGDSFLTMELVDGTDLASWVRGGGSAGTSEERSVTAETVREGREGREASGSEMRGPRGSGGSSGSGRSGGKSGRGGGEPIDTAGIARLRAAVVDLCAGLFVLHAAGVVHHDVTPSNVRVTPEGRVVLLDFGLAERAVGSPGGSQRTVAGTPRYMSPEQIRAEVTTPASDMFAVGCILYELLQGRSAFGGSLREIQVNKAAGEEPSALPRGGPDADLADLAIALLAREPAARPDARAVIRRLGGDARPLATTFGVGADGDFIGREQEIASLRTSLRQVSEEKRPRAVVVVGPSGIGKTTLVKRFLAEITRESQLAQLALLALSSRCHPQETIPFKALDAVMEGLATHAATRVELGAISGARAHALVRLFPALQAIPALANHPPPEVQPDNAELRALGFRALRDLLAYLAGQGPIAIWIDDAQWDDADSVALLDAVLSGADAPPILLVVGLRTGNLESGIVRRLVDARPMVPTCRLEVGPLGEGEVARLAALFLAGGDEEGHIPRVVGESGGNPFVARELARYLASAPAESGRLDVQGLVATRLESLPSHERALLAVVSIAVRPLTVPCALAAAGLGAEGQTSVLALRDAFLLLLESSPAGDTVAAYHDKIAEGTRSLLSKGDRAEAHRAIARSLERYEPADVDALCVHWEGGGDTPRAAACAYAAAGRSNATLAFGRAAELYEKALTLGFDGAPRALLLEHIATAHANVGRAAVAASRYLDASRALGDGVSNARVRTLKRLAAEQYIKGGYVQHGWEVMRTVLAEAGITPPASSRRATIDALGRRLRFLARRIDVGAIGQRQVPPSERARLEILWTASTSMSMVNVTLSDAFRTMHLERILDVGDASSIARALAYEVALEAHIGGPFFDWHAARLIEHARTLVDRTGDPYDRAWLGLGVANQAYCAGRFADAVDACRASERVLREECSGVAWELMTVAAFHLTSLAMLGDLRGLRAAAERLACDAEARGDLFGIAEAYGGECLLAWWQAGLVGKAIARAREASAAQGGDADRWPAKNYRRGQLTELMATVHERLLAGDPWPALKMIHEEWEDLKSAMLPSLQFYRSWLRHGRARVAIAAAGQLGENDRRGGWTRQRLLADARVMQREIAEDGRPFGAPWSALVEGALACASGERSHAIASVERAVAGFGSAGMALYREAARYRLGELTGSREQLAEASGWMQGEGISDLRALVGALAPGYP